MPNQPPPPRTRPRNFAAAVAAAAARLPAVTRAEAHGTARAYSVRYAVDQGPLVAVEDAPTTAEAVARFVAAATAEAPHGPGPAVAPRVPSTEEYLPPLHESVHELLLTAAECGTCRVFPLADWRTDDAANTGNRWAVAVPCPREDWPQMERGEIILYTELFTFVEGDDEPGAMALVTHAGQLLTYDDQRGLFYATIWNGDDYQESHLAADDVQEVWRVVRLIPTVQVNRTAKRMNVPAVVLHRSRGERHGRSGSVCFKQPKRGQRTTAGE